MIHKNDPDKQIHTIELFSGIKPSGYYAPQIWIGTGIPQDITPSPAWFVEIWINNTCVFRESASSAPDATNLQGSENELLERTMAQVFFHGIDSAYKFIKTTQQ
jgi:hypothetical protein